MDDNDKNFVDVMLSRSNICEIQELIDMQNIKLEEDDGFEIDSTEDDFMQTLKELNIPLDKPYGNRAGDIRKILLSHEEIK